MSGAARKSVTQNRLGTGGDERYFLALKAYLEGAGEPALGEAYELGRAAVADGKGILDFVAMHHAALQKLFSDPGTIGDAAHMLRSAEKFLVEGLSPYEMTHRGFREAIASLRHLNETLEQEIQRIARAVHDEAGQLLVAVHLALADVARDLPSPLRDRLQPVTGLLNQVEEQLRRLSHELRPTVLDDLGLAPAIRFLADGLSKRTGLAIPVITELQDRLPRNVETAVYRIAQEALTNAARHSGARSVRIQLERVGRVLRCAIADDGAGFDVSAVLASQPRKGLGLLGMQERLNAIGGTLKIRSAVGKGTELLIQLPLEE
jgi:signal transduction histidine kinase